MLFIFFKALSTLCIIFFYVKVVESIYPNITLNLSDIGLKKLSSNFIDSQYITALYLKNNDIHTLAPDAFSKLPNLQILDMSRNSGSYYQGTAGLFEYLDVFPSLEHIYLRRCNIFNLDFIGKNSMPKLKSIDLAFNSITDLSLKSLPPSLKMINLTGNRIHYINIGMSRNITHLDLSSNQLTCISKNINYVCHSSLEGLENIQYLSLSSNYIEIIDEDTFSNTRNLIQLDLSNNKIKLIYTNTFAMTNAMQNLTLDNNNLREIPNLSSMPFLTHLSLSNNKIETIDSTLFSNLTNLRDLILNNNLLETFETQNITDLTSLTYLGISYNKLHHLPRYWIIQFSNIKILDVRGNNFTSFNDLSISDSETLTDVFLQINQPLKLKKADFIGLSENLTIHIFCENEKDNSISVYDIDDDMI